MKFRVSEGVFTEAPKMSKVAKLRVTHFFCLNDICELRIAVQQDEDTEDSWELQPKFGEPGVLVLNRTWRGMGVNSEGDFEYSVDICARFYRDLNKIAIDSELRIGDKTVQGFVILGFEVEIIEP
jgi:hypothetical protein